MKSSLKNRYNFGYITGVLLAVAAVIYLLLPSSETHIANGPMIRGHEKLKCMECHKAEHGNLRQQLQANAQFLLNNRKEAVSVGLRPVENTECLSCHSRPNDRHPVYRFVEPKYSEVREKIGADSCTSCHLEHKNKRITAKANFCMHCHGELKLKKDPLDVPHHQLVNDKRWNTCLGCHDFHGNHLMKLKRNIDDVIGMDKLNDYFNRGENPYPGKIIHKAKTHNEK